MDKNEKKAFLKKLGFVACVIFMYVVLTNLRSLFNAVISLISLMSPLFIGILVALILYRPMVLIYKFFLLLKKKSKLKKHIPDKALYIISLTVAVLLALLVVFFVGNAVFPKIASSFKELIPSLNGLYKKVIAALSKRGIDTSDVEEFVSKLNFKDLWSAIGSNANRIYSTAIGAVSSIAGTIAAAVTSFIFSIYILANIKTLKRQAGKVLDAYTKPATAEKIKRLGMLIVSTFMNFFSGQCLEAVILGTIFFVLITVIRFPYALVISVVITVTAIVPYIGSFVGCAFGALLISIESPMKAVIFVAIFLVVNQLENNLIYPRVVGTSVNLPAMWTFVALIVGGAFFGVAGMLVFIPMTSVLYALLKNDVNHRISSSVKTDNQLPEKENEQK